mmetsp:Transcript_5673/g.17502  ORF Transcript_5673/g.17502 Transcript_5673/m.17502 type:complete len:231 (+) Transcript_5673:1157-1849(+)
MRCNNAASPAPSCAQRATRAAPAGRCGEGLEKKRLPSRAKSRPAFTARNEASGEPGAASASPRSRSVRGSPNPQQAASTTSGSASRMASQVLRTDLPSVLLKAGRQPAARIWPGTQLPPTKGGSSHSSRRTDGEEGAEVTALRNSSSEFWNLRCNGPASTPQASATAAKLAGTSARFAGSSETMRGGGESSAGLPQSSRTRGSLTAHTSQSACVTTTVGCWALSTSSRRP